MVSIFPSYQIFANFVLRTHDVEVYNEQAKFIGILVSDLEKMKLRVKSYEEANGQLQALMRFVMSFVILYNLSSTK